MYVDFEQIMRLALYIVILLQIKLCFGIKCYSCDGTIDRTKTTVDPCESPAEYLDNDKVKEITCKNDKLCWRATAGKKLTRGCGGKRCTFIPDVDMGSLFSQTCCSNDLCNRTSTKNLSKWTIISLILSIFVVK